MVVYPLFVVAPIVCVEGGCVRSLLWVAVLCVFSSFVIIPLGKRKLVALHVCVLNVISLLSFFDSSSRCHGLVCSM